MSGAIRPAPDCAEARDADGRISAVNTTAMDRNDSPTLTAARTRLDGIEILIPPHTPCVALRWPTDITSWYYGRCPPTIPQSQVCRPSGHHLAGQRIALVESQFG